MMAMNNYFLYAHQLSLDWDPQPFGAGVGDLHEQNLTLTMESQMPSEETSTGYLQDVLAGRSSSDGGRSKRRQRRLGALSPAMNENFQDLFQEFWNSEFYGSTLDNSSHQLQEQILISDYPVNSLWNSKAQTPAAPAFISSLSSSNQEIKPYSSQDSTTYKANQALDHQSRATTSMSEDYEEMRSELKKKKKTKKKKVMGLVYPFAVVKPGGVDGDETLADINARILMRPRRPVRHPVGEYAGGPCVADGGGQGLSGKAVVSLTRIHTRGRGTITIIRTRG